jgi:hypothetical protein
MIIIIFIIFNWNSQVFDQIFKNSEENDSFGDLKLVVMFNRLIKNNAI